MLEFTSRILRQNGYATLEAGTFSEALSLASSQDFELLLTVSVMPHMTGPALAERIAKLRPGHPVLYMSGHGAEVLIPRRILTRERTTSRSRSPAAPCWQSWTPRRVLHPSHQTHRDGDDQIPPLHHACRPRQPGSTSRTSPVSNAAARLPNSPGNRRRPGPGSVPPGIRRDRSWRHAPHPFGSIDL